jgi:hypothetical protein
MRVKFIAAALTAVALAGCADDVLIRHGYDEITGVTYTNVKSASDGAGGPRQDLLVATDAKGAVRGSWHAAGPGTWQTATEGAVGAALSAVGTFGAAAVLRPSNTNFTNTSTTSGGSIAPGAASANANPVNTATGGRGGAGGRGGNAAGGNATGGNAAGGNAAGGNALASPVVTANPTATASPHVTASGTGGNATAAGYGGSANARAGAAASARQNQNQNQGPQWNCTNSPPCN